MKIIPGLNATIIFIIIVALITLVFGDIDEAIYLVLTAILLELMVIEIKISGH